MPAELLGLPLLPLRAPPQLDDSDSDEEMPPPAQPPQQQDDSDESSDSDWAVSISDPEDTDYQL